ncbi:HutD family protein [Aeromonas veronii]|uniref:HutD family protein n=1 Tax=Aeromonas veronii TaxID=654 RepID=UPI0027DC74A0|nr:HutD family protein [Aeromonas veronii]EKP0313062.1 HutD family protein [Aeromonas veronii]WMJ06412.1 HutD family protein [Aeromonas veronii]
MITLIKESDHQKMPWKNQQGTTSQILISPKGSSLAKLDFDYRLSSAPIKSAGPFSPFPSYQRILLPVSGAGFVLNGHPYATFEAAHFSGDEETHCELLKKEVTDLGLIYHPDRISANVRVLNLPFPLTLTLEPEKTYLCHLLSGQLAVQGKDVAINETLMVTGEESIHFECQKNTAIAFFTLQAK